VFAISWGGILLIIGGPGRLPGTSEQIERLMLFALVALFAGPSIAGILMTSLVSGKTGLHQLVSRLLKWRVAAHWYGIALLPAPLLVTAVTLALSPLSRDFIPAIVTTDAKVSLLLFGVGWGLAGGGLLEELGWTGFAVPKLRLRYAAVTTALTVGVLWGVWHFLIALWTGGSLAAGHWTAYVFGVLFFYLGALPAYRVLMVWVYDRTESLLVPMLMHASLSASTLILQPPLTGAQFVMWNVALAAALWVVVAAVGVATLWHRGRQPLRRRAA
jgi:membrane protease YdiL (CAAX protease family)